MARRGRTAEDIVSKLRQVEFLTVQGRTDDPSILVALTPPASNLGQLCRARVYAPFASRFQALRPFRTAAIPVSQPRVLNRPLPFLAEPSPLGLPPAHFARPAGCRQKTMRRQTLRNDVPMTKNLALFCHQLDAPSRGGSRPQRAPPASESGCQFYHCRKEPFRPK